MRLKAATMSKLVTTIIFLFSGCLVFGQTNQEFEIFVNVNLEKITPGKKNIFITAKGDTIVYKVEDIIREMVKDQPKVSNTEATATNYKQAESTKAQEKLEFEPAVIDKTEEVKSVVQEKPSAPPKQEKITATEIQQKSIQSNPPVVTKTEPAKEVPKQNAADQSEIERLKEEARKKIKGAGNETVVKTKSETIIQPAKTEKSVLEVEKKNTVVEKAAQPVKTEKISAAGVVEVEKKKETDEKNVRYVNKKYYLEDRNLNSTNLNSADTLKFVSSFLSAYKDYPSLQFGSEGEFSLCYNYIVKVYNGYYEDLVEKNSTVYKVCQSGKWNDSKKTAEMFMQINSERKKIIYSIVQFDDKNLVLVKR